MLPMAPLLCEWIPSGHTPLPVGTRPLNQLRRQNGRVYRHVMCSAFLVIYILFWLDLLWLISSLKILVIYLPIYFRVASLVLWHSINSEDHRQRDMYQTTTKHSISPKHVQNSYYHKAIQQLLCLDGVQSIPCQFAVASKGFWLRHTMRFLYNTVNYLPNPHNGHPIVHLWGEALVSFVCLKSDLCSAAVITMLFATSW